MSISLNYLRNKYFAIYGLGTTGRSVINYFRDNNFKNYVGWDDNNKIFKRSLGSKYKKKKKDFLKLIDFADFIVVSPGINIKKAKLKKFLLKNRHKIITDLDLFYLLNPGVKSIVVTGTNGKSTTCKIIQHVLLKSKIDTCLGGNIGSPILSLNVKKKSIVVIEASSFQLAYSQFVRPDYALVLNITKDHLDWHETMQNYVKSKLKIFSIQNKNNFAFIKSKDLLKQIKKYKYNSKRIIVKTSEYKKIKKNIKNNYLNLEVNEENMSFVYSLSKILKIKKKNFIKSLKSFKGLEHRHEIFFKKDNKVFVNDSKATTFEASRFALKNNKNIFWIVGGKPKLGDRFKLYKIKKNIIKAYIIGKHMGNFKKHLAKKIKFQLCKNLNNAVFSIFKDTKNINEKKITILLSPASASYDQFENFQERGNKFKKIVKSYYK